MPNSQNKDTLKALETILKTNEPWIFLPVKKWFDQVSAVNGVTKPTVMSFNLKRCKAESRPHGRQV